ncbi:MAG: hypothetical protein GY769_10635, partial [bacterium]|nr:hypothetical protein [bacterium]
MSVIAYNPAASDINVAYETLATSGSFTVPAGDIYEFTMPANSGGRFGGSFGGTDGTYRDEFGAIAYDGTDGSIDWSSSPWIEVDAAGSGPAAGKVQVVSGELRLNGTPSGVDPSIAREADLSGAATAALRFDFRTGTGVEVAEDLVVIEVSANGGTDYSVLETLDLGPSAAGS